MGKENKLEDEINLESIIDKNKNGNGKFTLETDLRDFVKGIEYEVELPSRLKTILLAHGYATWGDRFRNIKDLILSYRNGVSNWSGKSRKMINFILSKYGFQELAPKRYVHSR
jgi:hypothetical protein